jgi:Zn-dependent M28 family amino/carboxypeptidase
MKRSLFIFLFVTSNHFILAQKGSPEVYASEIKASDLEQHLVIVAGKEMEGRETGTEGQRKAAAYIEKQFRSLGLTAPAATNRYQQLFPLHKDSLLKSSLKINDKKGKYGKDYIGLASHNENGGFVSDSIVFAGYGIDDKNYNDYTSLDVKGKVVMFFSGEPREKGKSLITLNEKASKWSQPALTSKITAAVNRGATGVVVINPSQESFDDDATIQSRISNIYFPRTYKDKKINYVILSHAFAKKLFKDRLNEPLIMAKENKPFATQSYFSLPVRVQYDYQEAKNVVEASNVVGIVEGSDKKDEYVVVTAHYDHLGMRNGNIYYGADDDGSGTVAILEMAAAFAKAKAEGNGPRRTLVFMTVSGEEKGLWGSEYYSDHPLFPLEKTSVNLNIDMIGRIDTERMKGDTLNYVYVVGHDKISSDLQPINEGVNNKYTGLVFDYMFDDPNDPNQIFYRSDHYNFAKKGVPVLFFYDGMLESDYHKPGDTVDKIYWGLFEKRARMIFHTAWEISNRDEMLKRDLPLPELRR